MSEENSRNVVALTKKFNSVYKGQILSLGNTVKVCSDKDIKELEKLFQDNKEAFLQRMDQLVLQYQGHHALTELETMKLTGRIIE